MLLAPESLSLTAAEIEICREYREEIEAVGYEFVIGEREAVLHGIPQDFSIEEAKEIFAGLVAGVLEKGEPIGLQRRMLFERALYQSSCKASVKGGSVYDEAHIRWICDNLFQSSKSTAANKQDISGINMQEFLLRVFSSSLGRNIGYRTFNDFQQGLLNPLS